MAHIELSSLTKRYGDITAVDDVSLTVGQGEFFTIVGPSGCGKSTTLRMIAGFETPTSGQILIDGTDVSELGPDKRDVGLVFQSYALFPHMTAAENVGFGLRMQGVSDAERQRRVADALSLVNLSDIADQAPDELSGGQQQRVALARALVIEPDVLLLDEPLSNLDQQLREDLQMELKRIQEQTGVTTIHVTHDQDEAMMLADQMCVLHAGQTEQIAAPKTVYHAPKTQFVSEFVGHANEFDVAVKKSGTDCEIVLTNVSSLRFPCPPSEKLTDGSGVLVVRPSDLHLNPPGTAKAGETRFKSRVDAEQFRGGSMQYTLTYTDTDGKTVEFTAHSNSEYEVGNEITVSVSDEDLIFHKGEMKK